MKSGVLDAVRAAGGELFGMTSEPQSLASEAEEAWEIGFPCVGDPHHEIRDQLQERGLVEPYRGAAAALHGRERKAQIVSHAFQPVAGGALLLEDLLAA